MRKLKPAPLLWPPRLLPLLRLPRRPRPRPGNLIDVKVKAGDSVKKGDVLVVLEAMKMENEIMAPHDAKVAQVLAAKGATVNTGDVLVVLE